MGVSDLAKRQIVLSNFLLSSILGRLNFQSSEFLVIYFLQNVKKGLTFCGDSIVLIVATKRKEVIRCRQEQVDQNLTITKM